MATRHSLPECDHGQVETHARGQVRCAKCGEWGAPGDTRREHERLVRLLRDEAIRLRLKGQHVKASGMDAAAALVAKEAA